jgi:hypothetical protein
MQYICVRIMSLFYILSVSQMMVLVFIYLCVFAGCG